MNNYEKITKNVKTDVSFSIPVRKFPNLILRPIFRTDLKNRDLVKNLASWRDMNSNWFPNKFKVTLEGTKKWLLNLVINNPDRVLFLIEDKSGKVYGHLGFYRYREQDNSCELDNVVRGRKGYSGLMTQACKALTVWGFKNLRVRKIYLTVFADNKKAINLYRRCNFKRDKLIPLKRIIKNGEVSWDELFDEKGAKTERYNLRMVLTR